MFMVDKKVLLSVTSYFQLNSLRELSFQHIINTLFPNTATQQIMVLIPCRPRNDITRITHHQ